MSQLTDITGLRLSGIFPQGREPSVRTVRDRTRLRCIPHNRVGHFMHFDPTEVADHILTKLKVPARGYKRQPTVAHNRCEIGPGAAGYRRSTEKANDNSFFAETADPRHEAHAHLAKLGMSIRSLDFRRFTTPHAIRRDERVAQPRGRKAWPDGWSKRPPLHHCP